MSSFLVGQLIQGMIRTYRDNIRKFGVYMQLCNIKFQQKVYSKMCTRFVGIPIWRFAWQTYGHPFKSWTHHAIFNQAAAHVLVSSCLWAVLYVNIYVYTFDTGCFHSLDWNAGLNLASKLGYIAYKSRPRQRHNWFLEIALSICMCVYVCVSLCVWVCVRVCVCLCVKLAQANCC